MKPQGRPEGRPSAVHVHRTPTDKTINDDIKRLLERAYEAVVDACENEGPADWESIGEPIAEALELVRERAA